MEWGTCILSSVSGKSLGGGGYPIIHTVKTVPSSDRLSGLNELSDDKDTAFICSFQIFSFCKACKANLFGIVEQIFYFCIQIIGAMTLETAKRIKTEGYVQGQDVRTYEQFMLLNKEADAILRGGMNICEEQENGSRKYTWIKVLPTKTDEESSIELALKKYQRRKQPRIREIKKTEPQPQQPSTKATHPPIIEEELNPLYKLAIKIKKVFYDFVKLLDEFVDE